MNIQGQYTIQQDTFGPQGLGYVPDKDYKSSTKITSLQIISLVISIILSLLLTLFIYYRQRL